VSELDDILSRPGNVLLIDWPLPEVPEALARAGWTVHVKGGPGATDFAVREVEEGRLVTRHTGKQPEHLDVVYLHRPLKELAGAVAAACQTGARLIWYQSGLAPDGTRDPRGCWLAPEQSQRARTEVEAAGLSYVDDCYIAAAVSGRS
jgi:hypothetical protein